MTEEKNSSEDENIKRSVGRPTGSLNEKTKKSKNLVCKLSSSLNGIIKAMGIVREKVKTLNNISSRNTKNAETSSNDEQNSKERKTRSDKGVKRGPYKTRQPKQNLNAEAATANAESKSSTESSGRQTTVEDTCASADKLVADT